MKTRPSLDFRQPRRTRFWGAQATGANKLVAAVALAIGGTGLVVGVATTWLSFQQERALRQQVLALQSEVQRLSPSKPAPPKPTSPQVLERQARIIHQINLPWADVLSTLEQLRPKGVALVSMEPAGTAALRLQTESLSLDPLLAHAAALQSTGPFGSLVYSRHETNERDPNRPVRLSFDIALKGRANP